MCLKIKGEPGKCLTKHDPVKDILFGQWRYNKVMSFLSTLPLVGEEMANRQHGREAKTSKCPSTLCEYNCFMGYVGLVYYNEKLEEKLLLDLISRNGTKKVIWGYSISCW